MLPYFSQEERDTADLAEIEQRSALLAEVHTYNRRYSGEPRTLMEMIRDLPVLLRHLVHYLFSGEGLHLAFQLRVAVLAAMWLLYLLSPLDLIPEAVFGLVGLLDDLVIFLLISMYLTFFFRSWPIWERIFLPASISDQLDKCHDLYPIVLPKIKIFSSLPRYQA